MIEYRDKEGNLITQERLLELFSEPDYKHVGYDEVGKYRISTVWLGIPHFGASDECDYYFETMVFEGEGWDDSDMARYKTLEQAQEGHKKFVEKYKNDSK